MSPSVGARSRSDRQDPIEKVVVAVRARRGTPGFVNVSRPAGALSANLRPVYVPTGLIAWWVIVSSRGVAENQVSRNLDVFI